MPTPAGDDAMSLNIQLFGPLADTAQARTIRIDSPTPLNAAQVMEEIARVRPQLRPMLGSARLAVNCAFVGPDHVVLASDELALIGMVSGG